MNRKRGRAFEWPIKSRNPQATIFPVKDIFYQKFHPTFTNPAIRPKIIAQIMFFSPYDIAFIAAVPLVGSCRISILFSGDLGGLELVSPLCLRKGGLHLRPPRKVAFTSDRQETLLVSGQDPMRGWATTCAPKPCRFELFLGPIISKIFKDKFLVFKVDGNSILRP